MDESKSTFSLATKPGFIISGVSIILSLLLWALVDDITTQQQIGYFTWLIIAFLYYYFAKNYRENELAGNMPYGKAFKFMFLIGLIVSAFTALYTYVLFAYLDPGMIEAIKEQAAEKLYEQNLSDEQVEQAIEMQSAFMSAGIMTISTFFASVFFNTVLSLIIAIFVKKEVVTFED